MMEAMIVSIPRCYHMYVNVYVTLFSKSIQFVEIVTKT